MLSWFLMQHGQSVLVIDKLNHSSATHVASGIVNPITGRRFVKSWLADNIIPFAEKTYRQLEAELNAHFYTSIPIVKMLDSPGAQNDWSVRTANPEYSRYLSNESVVWLDSSKVKNEFGGFEICGSRLDTQMFLTLFRQRLIGINALVDEFFSFPDLEVTNERVTYKSCTASKIIFCEGAQAIYNPYFRFLPFQLAKGECLVVSIDNFYPDRIINGEVFIMPLGADNLYYVGATHEWHFDNDLPSNKGRDELEGNLRSLIKADFSVIEHKAAVRPTVKDRRPFIGFHPDFSNIGIFNGMGTKGISLSPYLAKHFCMHLLQQMPLLKEVDIQRFS